VDRVLRCWFAGRSHVFVCALGVNVMVFVGLQMH